MTSPDDSRSLTRGKLLKAGAAAAFVVGAGAGARAVAADGEPGLPADGVGRPQGGPSYLRRETYLPLVGATFRARRPAGGTFRLKLTQAQQLRGPGETFSLLFRAGSRTPAEEGIYRFEHPTLGEFELFASPVGRGVKGLDLEAVVNRIAT